ncbi:MAG TPA: isochorismatase family cysteine hydrolase [Puia sp.]|nr:isochorismatase family cysteine hydrolase [Puia sp.]
MYNVRKDLSPTPALLVMDMQTTILSRLEDKGATFIPSVKAAIEAARAAFVPVIYVVVGFRKGYPEISLDNKSFSFIKLNSTTVPSMEEPIKIHPDLAPKPGEIVITKRRVSAFTGSDLEVVLRSLKVQQLVLSGISTSGVVLSTLREAADKDYYLSVLSDCCIDLDNEVHTVLLSKVFPRQADVITAGEWATRIK